MERRHRILELESRGKRWIVTARDASGPAAHSTTVYSAPGRDDCVRWMTAARENADPKLERASFETWFGRRGTDVRHEKLEELAYRLAVNGRGIDAHLSELGRGGEAQIITVPTEHRHQLGEYPGGVALCVWTNEYGRPPTMAATVLTAAEKEAAKASSIETALADAVKWHREHPADDDHLTQTVSRLLEKRLDRPPGDDSLIRAEGIGQRVAVDDRRRQWWLEVHRTHVPAGRIGELGSGTTGAFHYAQERTTREKLGLEKDGHGFAVWQPDEGGDDEPDSDGLVVRELSTDDLRALEANSLETSVHRASYRYPRWVADRRLPAEHPGPLLVQMYGDRNQEPYGLAIEDAGG